ncbi:MAG: hypothetical protein HC923_04805 [Myxococcales bacterium]|nr:hypothetical protein [Myxococcales bacterium]
MKILHCAAATFLAILMSGPSAFAAKKGGVELPDSHSLDGQTLTLNGLGIREATFLAIDVYVAGLYLPQKSQEMTEIVKADVPKHLVMRFVRDVDRGKQADAWKEGFKKNAKDFKAIEGKVEELTSWMEDIKNGEQMAVSYVPGKGTTMTVKGQTKGTIEGEDFQEALFKIYLGPNPPNSGLRDGLLGR